MAQSFAPCISLLIAFFFLSSTSAGWVLEDTYDASNWFSEFNLFTGPDPTNGWVDYVDQGTAQADGLINTNNNQIYMGVDYTNNAPNGRPSVRVTSSKAYNTGTLIILDLEHMPVGLGTWPAFWTLGPNWPNNGEIDIIEGVNLQTQNDMTLHTGPGCTITRNSQFSGSISTSNCDINAAGQATNAGCSIAAGSTSTYGAGLNAVNGGVYILEWTSDFIAVYFFPRSSIPADITSGSPNPSGWGEPLAQFSGGCNIPQFFQNNQIVFDTTFCGDWAGNVWTTTPGVNLAQYPTCNGYVENNPGAFKDAYWLINSLKVYSGSGSSTSSNPPATTEQSGSVQTNPLVSNQVSVNGDGEVQVPAPAGTGSTPAANPPAANPPAANPPAANTPTTTMVVVTVANNPAPAAATPTDDEPPQNAFTTSGEGIVSEDDQLKRRGSAYTESGEGIVKVERRASPYAESDDGGVVKVDRRGSAYTETDEGTVKVDGPFERRGSAYTDSEEGVVKVNDRVKRRRASGRRRRSSAGDMIARLKEEAAFFVKTPGTAESNKRR